MAEGHPGDARNGHPRAQRAAAGVGASLAPCRPEPALSQGMCGKVLLISSPPVRPSTDLMQVGHPSRTLNRRSKDDATGFAVQSPTQVLVCW